MRDGEKKYLVLRRARTWRQTRWPGVSGKSGNDGEELGKF